MNEYFIIASLVLTLVVVSVAYFLEYKEHKDLKNKTKHYLIDPFKHSIEN